MGPFCNLFIERPSYKYRQYEYFDSEYSMSTKYENVYVF